MSAVRGQFHEISSIIIFVKSGVFSEILFLAFVLLFARADPGPTSKFSWIAHHYLSVASVRGL